MDAPYGRPPTTSAIPIADSTPRRSPSYAPPGQSRRDEYAYDSYPSGGRGGPGEGMRGDDREYSNGDSYIPEETRRAGGAYGGFRGRGREFRQDGRQGGLPCPASLFPPTER